MDKEPLGLPQSVPGSEEPKVDPKYFGEGMMALACPFSTSSSLSR
jgi:hypothetical protein